MSFYMQQNHFKHSKIFWLFRFGPRFVGLRSAYDRNWRKIVKEVANTLELQDKIKEGVYIMLGGPNFETPAELAMLKSSVGVDAVGKLTTHTYVIGK